MPRCAGQTQKGEQCKNQAREGSKYCHLHKQFDTQTILASTVGGAMVGSLIFPGAGAVVGGIIGAWLGSMAEKEPQQ